MIRSGVRPKGSSFTFIILSLWFLGGLATYPIYNPVVYVGMTDTIAYTYDKGDVRVPHLDHPVCDHLSGNIELLVMDFDCTTPIPGHYVIIDSYKQGEAHYLYFAELEVHGYC